MMRRIQITATAVILLLISAVGISGDPGADSKPRVRTFYFEYQADLKGISAGAKRVDLWLPIPHDDTWQQIKDLRIDSRYSYSIAKAADGNQILHVGLNEPKGPVSVKISVEASRQEHIQSSLQDARLIQKEDAAQLAPYLKPDRLAPIDHQIRAWAQDVVDKANAHTDLEKARAIYNHVVSTVKYDKSGQGWGRGDIYYACEARRGNCTDFHAIFIGYCRALGIPARFAIGFPLPAERGQGKVAGYHCWAEFYAKNTGWVPIDASEAAKNPSKREYFFGAHDENRIELTKDRDVMLLPRQHGQPLNYFVYPYVEVDGKSFADVGFAAAYRDRASSGRADHLSLIRRN